MRRKSLEHRRHRKPDVQELKQRRPIMSCTVISISVTNRPKSGPSIDRSETRSIEVSRAKPRITAAASTAAAAPERTESNRFSSQRARQVPQAPSTMDFTYS